MEIANGLLQTTQLNPNYANIESTDLVMFFGGSQLEHMILFLAMGYLSVTITPSKPANGPYETVRQFNNSGAKILCVSKSKLPVIEQILNSDHKQEFCSKLKMLILMDCNEIPEQLKDVLKQVITFEQLHAIGSGSVLSQIPYFSVPDWLRSNHAIVYTSGSTGLPKGALLSHRSFMAKLTNWVEWGDALRKNRDGSANYIHPLGHISGSLMSWGYLFSQVGGT